MLTATDNRPSGVRPGDGPQPLTVKRTNEIAAAEQEEDGTRTSEDLIRG
jgi:hypothetical protein